MNRFGDIDCSFKRLTPVYGYHSAQLLALEKALEPIEHQIDQLSRYIKVAKKHCHFPSEHGLSKDQSAAIYIYTMEWGDQTLYRVLNKALRSEDRQSLKIWFPYLKLFDTALDKLPTVKEAVWRGVPLDVGKNFRENQLVTWWSINSCSSSVNVIKQFLGNNNHNSTLFLIEAINGKKISSYTEYENEREVILRMGTQFRVKSNPLEQSNGSHLVHLIEINDGDDHDGSSATAMKNIQISTQPSSQNTSGQVIFSTHINNKSKWKQNGIIVAGGNGEGNRLDQLNRPSSIYVDDDRQSIYISDWGNHRILEWKYGAKSGQIIAGGNGRGNRNNQLADAHSFVVDKSNDSLIIADYGNQRVVRWPRQNGTKGQTIISNIRSVGLALDHHGDLYVCEQSNNEVRRWKKGETTGTLVAGGNGRGNQLNQLNAPAGIFVDKDLSVYVLDWVDDRIMKWMKGVKEGTVVAGGRGKGDNLTQLSRPLAVTVDDLSNIYVADSRNYRIMRWLKGSKEGSIVVGGNGQGTQSNQIDYPTDLSFDREGNLYVVDCNNNRVQKFEMIPS